MIIKLARRLNGVPTELSGRTMDVAEYNRLSPREQDLRSASAGWLAKFGIFADRHTLGDYCADYFDQQWDLFFVELLHEP